MNLMAQSRPCKSPVLFVICALLTACFLPVASRSALAEPATAATAAFNKYAAGVEARLQQGRHSPNSLLAGMQPQDAQRLRNGDLIVSQIASANPSDFPGALLHHWSATALAPGAKAADLDRILRDFNAYPQLFAPEVLSAKILTQSGDSLTASMRVRQKHVLTVVMDSTYAVDFGRPNPQSGFSTSRSTAMHEIASAGTASEHPLSSEDEHGFLWRQNTYWTWEERDNGLYIQIESISLSRSIPTGLGWAIRPFVESVPSESLEFTLRSAIKAIRR